MKLLGSVVQVLLQEPLQTHKKDKRESVESSLTAPVVGEERWQSQCQST